MSRFGAVAAVLVGALLLPFSHAHPSRFHSVARLDSSPVNLNGSIHDQIMLSGMDPPNQFDNNRSDFDILRNLFVFAEQGDLLKSEGIQDERGITLLAPNDGALIQTAKDLLELRNFAGVGIPTTEQQGYDVILRWLQLYRSPKEVLTRILMYHIINIRELEPRDLLNKEFETSMGEIIRISGFILRHNNPDLPNPNIISVGIHFQTTNGIIHIIDRMLFPNPNNLPPLRSRPDSSQGPRTSASPSPSRLPFAPPGGLQPSVPTQLPTTDPDSPRDPLSSRNPTQSLGESPTSTPTANEGPACFPGSAIVHLRNGSDIPLARLEAGHEIMASGTTSSKVYFFSHRQHAGLHAFLRITSEEGQTVTLTKGHYLYVNRRRKAADYVKVGDVLQTLHGESKVRKIERVTQEGLFAPHTLHGDLIVNEVLVSSYTTAISPRVAHMILWPFRVLVGVGVATEPLGSLLYNGWSSAAAFAPKEQVVS